MDQGKREHIIEVAHQIFLRFGYKKTSIEDVAKKAGVAKGTVYLAVNSKGDLFYEVLLRELRDWEAEITRTLDPAMPADQQLAFASRYGLELLQRRSLLQGLFSLHTDNIVPELAGRLESLRHGGLELTMNILRSGISQGIFRREIDVESVATLLQDVQMATILFHVRDTPLDNPELVTRLDRRGTAVFDLLMHGLRTDS